MQINIWMAAGGLNVTQASRKGSVYSASAFISQDLVVRAIPGCEPMHVCGTKTAAAGLSQPFVFAVFVLLFGVSGTGGTTRVLL